jgi:hypothetical protein
MKAKDLIEGFKKKEYGWDEETQTYRYADPMRFTRNSPMIELSRRAVACKHWQWMPGMLARYSDGKPWYRLTEADSYGIRPPKCRPPDPRRARPDLTDPATLGCLLALVRESKKDPCWQVLCLGEDAWSIEGANYPTEAEALVAALEASE